MTRKKTHRGRKIGMLLVVLALGPLSYVGWNWLDGLVCTRITIDGARHATRDGILAVARVDTGVRLLDLEPTLIADRVKRHPWILEAEVHRIPPGTIAIDVEERMPVALAIDAAGRPSAYLDAHGYAMPMVDGAVYDVPLLRRVRLPENRTQPVESRSVIALLRALQDLEMSENALISSFEIDPTGDVTLYTEPAGRRGAIVVRLGRENYDEKLTRLDAFWHQAVLSRPEIAFDLIDLRFDSQIVTKES